MYSHEKPKGSFSFDLNDELKIMDKHRIHRKIPEKKGNNLLIATWNLTNFGLQKRKDEHLKIMAHILSFFDLIAVQEIADNLNHMDKLLSFLGSSWNAVYTDVAGNYERLAFIYDTKRVTTTGLAAELAMRGYERRKIIIEDVVKSEKKFEGFNRNPHMLGFKAGKFEFTLVNVHLYWSDFSIRQLETYALSRWAKKRTTKKFPPNNDIILIGDFNIPRLREKDKIYKQLKSNGLVLPKFNTEMIGSNLAGDKHYDEIAFFPHKTLKDFDKNMGVFDFDKKLFPKLWVSNTPRNEEFYKYIRYYIADHRPLWAVFKR